MGIGGHAALVLAGVRTAGAAAHDHADPSGVAIEFAWWRNCSGIAVTCDSVSWLFQMRPASMLAITAFVPVKPAL